MKTVLHETVNGHDIIVGFDKPTVDAVATNVIVSEAIKDTAEYKAAEAKKSEYTQACADLQAAANAKDTPKYQATTKIMDALQEELKPLALSLDEAIIRLRRENAVYFEPRKGEAIIPAAEAKRLMAAINSKPHGAFIATDGSVVMDNRGKAYYRRVDGKWMRTTVIKLGDDIPADAVLSDDLNDKQRGEVEVDRVAMLSADDKATEKQRRMLNITNNAAAMRSELEIKGDTDALKKTQAWYKKEVKVIEALYG